ncbi:MAG: threonine/serine dehydratase [Pseudomonadota bacterium]
MSTPAAVATDETPVSIDGVRAAAARLKGIARRTPLLEDDDLNARVGGRVLLKAEVLQHGGSFKLRGAYNLLASLDPAVRARGVVAWSSGNHAQGIAIAARRFGVPATIVMPNDAPAAKRDAVLALGAEIVPYDRFRDDREAIARTLAARDGRAIAPSYDHPRVIEGQGTLTLEVQEDAPPLDLFVVCCGGGGLAAGGATVLEDAAPDARVVVAEPEGYDMTGAALRYGPPQYADISVPTLCDAIATPTQGALTFPILKRVGAHGVSVRETEVLRAMAWAYARLRLVVEPGGAVALAALLFGKVDAAGKTVAATLSGGNVDPAVFQRALEAGPPAARRAM